MNRLTVVPSMLEDPDLLAPHLRQADRDEVAAASGLEPALALRQGMEQSVEPYTVIAAGRPVAMFGVVDLGLAGAPWLLGSDALLEHWFEFARRSRVEFERVRRPWPYLFNYVDDRNQLHQRWLRWLGFEFTELEAHYGVGRLPFWRFEFRV